MVLFWVRLWEEVDRSEPEGGGSLPVLHCAASLSSGCSLLLSHITTPEEFLCSFSWRRAERGAHTHTHSSLPETHTHTPPSLKHTHTHSGLRAAPRYRSGSVLSRPAQAGGGEGDAAVRPGETQRSGRDGHGRVPGEEGRLLRSGPHQVLCVGVKDRFGCESEPSGVSRRVTVI